MLIYRAKFYGNYIESMDADSETLHYFILMSGARVKKRSSGTAYFHNLEAAKAFIVNELARKQQGYQEAITATQKEIEKVNSITSVNHTNSYW